MGHMQKFSLDTDGDQVREVDSAEVLAALKRVWQHELERQKISVVLQIIVRSYVWYWGSYSEPKQAFARWVRICQDFREFTKSGELPHYVIRAYAQVAHVS